MREVISTSTAQFGEPGCDLLPINLRVRFGVRRLPPAARLGGLIQRYDQLNSRAWDQPGVTVPMALMAAKAALRAVLPELSDEPVLAGWPAGLVPGALPWRSHSIRVLKRLGAWSDPERLRRFTYGELAAVPSVGTLTILDISVTGGRVVGFGADVPIAVLPASWLEALGEAEEACAVLQSTSWFTAVHNDDPRFGATATAARAVVNHTAASFPERELRHLPGAVQSMTRAADRRHPELLENALAAVLVATMPKLRASKRDAVLQRFGWTGGTPITLEAGALLAGVTAERIRQITAAADRRKSPHPPLLPALDLAIELLRQSLPMDEDAFRAGQRRLGLSAVGITVEGLRHAARWNHRKFPDVEFAANTRTRRVISTNTHGLEKRVIAETRRQCRAWGAASVSEIIVRVADEIPAPSRESVQDGIASIDGVTVDGEWWIVETAKNHMGTEIRKMLAVCGGLTPAQLHGGLSRQYRMYHLPVPSESAVRLGCQQLPGVRFGGDRACLDPVIDGGKVLGHIDSTIVDVLRKAPDGVLDRGSLVRACMDRGVPKGSSYVYAGFTSILEEPAENVMALRGTS